MSLQKYLAKRKFDKTTEPKGKIKQSDKTAIFVVQKHRARTLHYDFRLEMDGVLKSWAVPKGPSINPADKRLAIMVEDHPLEYASFEGTIPEGQYGAGKVEIWDKGTVEFLNRDLAGGHLTFILDGKKLKGEFALVKIKRPRSRGGKPWLLIKAGDKNPPHKPTSTYEVQVKRSDNPRNIKECPFETEPKTNEPATWLKPKLVGQVKFAEWTRDGLMRQPIFLGLREDKSAKDVRREGFKNA